MSFATYSSRLPRIEGEPGGPVQLRRRSLDDANRRFVAGCQTAVDADGWLVDRAGTRHCLVAPERPVRPCPAAPVPAATFLGADIVRRAEVGDVDHVLLRVVARSRAGRRAWSQAPGASGSANHPLRRSSCRRRSPNHAESSSALRRALRRPRSRTSRAAWRCCAPAPHCRWRRRRRRRWCRECRC